MSEYQYTYHCSREGCVDFTSNKLRKLCSCRRSLRLVASTDPDNQPKPERLRKPKAIKPVKERLRGNYGQYIKRAN